MLLHLGAGRLPSHCQPENAFLHYLSSTFDTCIPSTLAFISTILGILSILSWLFAQLPQIIKNFQLRSTSGLSIFFLAEWLLGDLANLFGSIFTEQATWQVVLASYYVSVDCILVGQWIWYECLRHGRVVRRLRWWRRSPTDESAEPRPPRRRKKNQVPKVVIQGVGNTQPIATKPRKSLLDETTGSGGNSPRISTSPFRLPPFSFSSAASTLTNNPNNASTQPRQILRPSAPASPIPSPRTVLLITLLITIVSTHASPLSTSPPTAGILSVTSSTNTGIDWAGRILSWLSTVLYLGSRLPQLLLNHSRRSTAGLSPTLFAAAFCGNLFYSSSLLTNPCLWGSYPPYGGGGWVGPDGSNRGTWAMRAAPFWLGAAGVLVLDAAMGVQFVVFGDGKSKDADVAEVLVVEEVGVRGPGRWRRVSGWMRGWMPSAAGGHAKRVNESGFETETETETDTATETDSLLSGGMGDDASSVRSYGTAR